MPNRRAAGLIYLFIYLNEHDFLWNLGCYVPADSCEFSVVDRIFTRIGAGDKLVEGKSTFYIEMEEVRNAVCYGTYNSLVIFDELGRGTSTFDGVAIAFGILKYFVEKLPARCIFATHFFLLVNELRFYREISFFHMDYTYDEYAKRLSFKYKITQGSATSSFGVNLAKVLRGADKNTNILFFQSLFGMCNPNLINRL